MWFRPTLEAERDQAFRYGAVPEWRTDRLEGHAATASPASPSHASGHWKTLAARQSMDLEAEALSVVYGHPPGKPLRGDPLLLSAYHPINSQATWTTSISASLGYECIILGPARAAENIFECHMPGTPRRDLSFDGGRFRAFCNRELVQLHQPTL